MTAVRIEHVNKFYGQAHALRDIDLDVRAGELFFLLGPSGCGKSTLLRMIAGLQQPNSGRIWFGNRDVTSLGTEQRNAVMCFQNYALWPHMSVRDNILFGLNLRKMPAESRQTQANEVLRLVQMEAYADRKPNSLSGGQQQRAALARALAVQPDCLLLDEPLSNLDAKLRQEMRSEIRRICKSGGFTTIYVTHDQKEALSVADRIALMNDGRVVQIGTPGELYYQPRCVFVADFLGQTNLLSGEVIEVADGVLTARTAFGIIRATGAASPSQKITISVRPEQLRVVSDQPAPSEARNQNRISGKVIETTFVGEATEHVLSANGNRLKIFITPPLFDPPRELTVQFGVGDAIALER